MVSEIIENSGLSLGLATPPPEVLLTPNIGVMGVGGAGGNAVNNMVQSNLTGVSFFVANTDAQALAKSLVADKIQLGIALTKGLGAGANPEVGKAAAEESIDKIKEALNGLHLLFLTAGMGGGTGTGAAPVVARAAKELGIMTVGVVSKPFNFEGSRRMKTAETGIIELQKYIDTLIVIPNQNLFRIDDGTMTFNNGFKIADGVLCQGVRSITDLIMKTGLINHDFADVQAVLSTKGRCVLGSGEASGENRARLAAEQAMSNPLLDNSSIAGARSLLLNISGAANDLTAIEVDTAAELIRQQVDPDANIIFGSNVDEELAGKVRVSLVATGIDDLATPSSPEVHKPTIPPVEPRIEVTPPVTFPEVQTAPAPEKKQEEPVLINVPPTQPETAPLISPDLTFDSIRSDLVVDLATAPIETEPTLIDDPVPTISEMTPIQDIPEIQPEINVATRSVQENVKPASPSIWHLFRSPKKRISKPQPAVKEHEPSLLDELDDFEADMDLPSFMTNPRR